MERYFYIAKIHLKYSFFPHILVSIGLLCLMPAIMGIKNLDATQAAQVLETYVAMIGIVLFIPLFFPEQNHDIRDLIESKKMPICQIHLIRFAESFFTLIFLVFAVIKILSSQNCEFPEVNYFLGTVAEALFLGGLGVVTYSLCDTIPAAYMIPLVYYIINYSGQAYLGFFQLFSMTRGSYKEKWYLFFGAVVFFLLGIFYRARPWKIRKL